jgi:hypothetical protein
MSDGYRLNGGVIGYTHNWTATKSGVWDTTVVYGNNVIPPRGSVIIRPNANNDSGTNNHAYYLWTVPTGVTSVCILCVGGGGGGSTSTQSSNGVAGGGGGGGGLGYRNNYSVTPGQQLAAYVGYGGNGGTSSGNNNAWYGGQSYIYYGTNICYAAGGVKGSYNVTSGYGTAANGGTDYAYNDGGGRGGQPANGSSGNGSGGGSGAGGYSGNGGLGGRYNSNPTAGAGGGGGGGGSVNGWTAAVTAKGGGVALFGQGADGAASASNNTQGNLTTQGYRGSEANSTTIKSGEYGGGGCGCEDDSGGAAAPGNRGAIRIMWGVDRAFPSTNADEANDEGNTTTISV